MIILPFNWISQPQAPLLLRRFNRSVSRSKTVPVSLVLSSFYDSSPALLNEKQWCRVAHALMEYSKQGNRQELLETARKINQAALNSLAFRARPLATLAQVSVVYGKLGLHSPRWIAVIKGYLHREQLCEATLEDLSKMAWSFALLGEWDRPLLEKMARSVENKIKQGDELHIEAAYRLKPVSLAGRVKWNQEILGKATVCKVNECLQARQYLFPRGSDFQRQVTAWVKSVSPSDWVSEYFFEGYHFDLACPSRMLAVEVDGPRHYYVGTKELQARDRLMDELFFSLGWKIIRIPYWEWEEADTYAKRREYIRGKIEF